MTRSIGRRCKGSNAFSLPVLIGRGLDLASSTFVPCAVVKVQAPPAQRTTSRPVPEPLQLNRFPVRMAEGQHPFPFRTRPLSPPAPMVLPGQLGGRVGPRRKTFYAQPRAGLFCTEGHGPPVGCALGSHA